MFRGCIVLILALLLSGASAQSSSHPVTIGIPDFIGIKIVNATGGISVNPSVIFDFDSDPTIYLNALQGSGTLSPTGVNNFANVQIQVQQRAWSVWVEALPLSYYGNDTGTGLALSDIRVERGAVSGLTADVLSIHPSHRLDDSWILSNNPQRIGRGSRATNGWRNLGFNGLDYTLSVQGDESSGRYTTVVYYSLTNP